MMESTGPKISSWAMVMSVVTSENTVGWTKYPFSKPFGDLWAADDQLGPSSMPFGYASHPVALGGRDQWAEHDARLEGVPRREASGRGGRLLLHFGQAERGTIMRVRAEQVCPELR